MFIIYIVALNIDSGDEIHPSKRAQIAYLKADEASTKVFSKYANFEDVFLPKLIIKFLKHTKIIYYIIKLKDDWQPLYGFIYSLELVKLETLKAYIKNNRANSFIRLFKSSIRASIFFDKKPNRSQRLYIDYQGLNNLIIKNWYLLFLVGKSLN